MVSQAVASLEQGLAPPPPTKKRKPTPEPAGAGAGTSAAAAPPAPPVVSAATAGLAAKLAALAVTYSALAGKLRGAEVAWERREYSKVGR
jgi:hypothetical protein